jgi:hypothetical protein
VNKASAILWGFVSTVVLTTLMSGSQGLGLTRMSLPYILRRGLSELAPSDLVAWRDHRPGTCALCPDGSHAGLAGAASAHGE